jgi:putative ABC transport system substrate-binding protein
LDGAFRTATSQRAGALIILPGPVLELHRKRFVDLAAKRRLPAMFGNRDFVEAGGLMSYGPDIVDLFRRAATYVDKILKGTARKLGLTIPPALLLRADQIIE